MCNNAMVYNAPETIYYKAAKKLIQTGSKLLSPVSTNTQTFWVIMCNTGSYVHVTLINGCVLTFMSICGLELSQVSNILKGKQPHM